MARESHLALLGHELGDQLPNGGELRAQMESISPSQTGADTSIDAALCGVMNYNSSASTAKDAESQERFVFAKRRGAAYRHVLSWRAGAT